jgi:putative flippase GtrA
VPTRSPETEGISLIDRAASHRLVRFACVGGVVTVFFMGFNALLARGFGFGAQSAFLASYPPALALHFTLNKIWTFGDRRATSARHVGDYLFSVVVTFLIQWPAFIALHGMLSLPGWVAAGGANVIQMTASYLFLRHRVFKAVKDEHPSESLSSWLRLATLVAAVGAAAFIAWTVSTTGYRLEFHGPKRDYYNLLAQGFRKGHLYMDAAPDRALLALPASERPGNAPFLLDASLYRGHYYLYFGVVPVVLLYLPYAALTGQGLPEAGAALFFASAGLIFAALWWFDARRRLFPRSGAAWALVSLLAIALGSAMPSTLRRPIFYEVAITAGYAFMMLALWAFTRARYASERRTAWLVLGAVAAGLAVGSRANLAPSCLVLVVCGAAAAGTGRRRGMASALFAAGLAFSAVIAALGGYNAARFGDPLEFGHTYQIGVEPKQLFHLANLGHNARLYYLRPPALNGFFPFMAPAPESIKPDDYVGRESAHGEWVWLPLAIAALGAWIGMSRGRAREGQREAKWIVGLPAAVFAVNFIVTASVGVRANRYMLDFHPMLVLAVLGVLGMGLAGAGRLARLGSLAAGAAILVAVVFNMLGSIQAQGFFRFTDPIVYSRVAAAADHLVWPLLRAEPTVGDRVVRLRWPLHPTRAALEPVGAAGTPGYDDVLWVEYGAGEQARLVYQYWEYGRAFGRWFAFEPGKTSEMRVSGAFLLPRPGHPWFGGRPMDEQEILKRSLCVSVDGVTRFERDVPSHDSSPALQSWGAWRHADGTEHAFRGAILGVRSEPVRDPVALRQAADWGTVRMRLEFSPRCLGTSEPLLQSGSPQAFDTLVVRYVRPGFVQLIHDQLGGGARSSREFAVDYSGAQHVEVELPFADDRVDWLADGPAFRDKDTERMRVTWNGRVVFEPELPPVPADRRSVALGANLLNSSVARATFEGILEEEPPRKALGAIGAGSLEFRPEASVAFEDEHGTLVRFDRDDGRAAGLAWRRGETAGSVYLGWTEGGISTWSSRPVAGVRGPITVSLSRDGAAIGDVSARGDPGSLGRLVVEKGASPVLAQRTSFFSAGSVRAHASGGGAWSGTALVGAPGTGSARSSAAQPPALPGRIRLSFLTPRQGRISSSPLVEAGRAGAADSLYLRGLADGRYVVGLDHWSVGAVESAPFDLADGDIHTIGVEMASLDAGRQAPGGAVRISVDGRMVMDRVTALYAVLPGEVVFGANPLGMSTSGSLFEGDLIVVRTHQAAEDLFPGNR